MIRITVGNRNINEIKSDTHQYEFTKINTEKKPLDFIFGNKYRLVEKIKIDVSPICDDDYKISQAVSYCLVENRATFLKYLKVDSPRNEREAESFNKLKNSTLYKLYIDYCKKNTKKINEDSLDLFYGDYLAKIVSDTMKKTKQYFFNKETVYDFSNNTILCNGKKVNLFNFFESLSAIPINSINRNFKTGKFSFESSMEEEGLKKLREMNKFIRTVNIDIEEEQILNKLSNIRFANLYSIVYSYDLTKIVLNSFMLETLKIKPDEKGQIKVPDIYKTIVLSRVSRDIVRMSDFPQLQSCHSVGGDYASCTVQEAISTGGAIAYLFDKDISDDVKKDIETDPTEFMYDPDREESKNLIYKPVGRIRLRTYILYNKELKSMLGNKSEKIYLVVPSVTKTYGRASVSFKDYVKKLCYDKQKNLINNLLTVLNKDVRIGFELMGGTYSDETDASEIVSEFLGVDEDSFVAKILNTTEFKESDSIDPIMEKDVVEAYESTFKDLRLEADMIVDTKIENVHTGLKSGHPYEINNKYDVTTSVTLKCKKEYIDERISDLLANTDFLISIGITDEEDMENFTYYVSRYDQWIYATMREIMYDRYPSSNFFMDSNFKIIKKLGPYIEKSLIEPPILAPDEFKKDVEQLKDELEDIIIRTSRDEKLLSFIKSKVFRNRQLQEIKHFFKRLI